MPTWSCQFQHPDTGRDVTATYAFGFVRFEVCSTDYWIPDYLPEEDRPELDRIEEETWQAIVRDGGTRKGRGVRARSLDEAQNVVKRVARDQFDWGLEED